jgi:hypothetical protein
LIAAPNGIAKRGLVRDEGRRFNGVALSRFVTDVAKFRYLVPTRDQRELSLDSLQLAAFSAPASGLETWSFRSAKTQWPA